MLVAQGFTSRLPLTNKLLITKTSIGSLKLDIHLCDIKQIANETEPGLCRHYIIAVKDSNDTSVNIYWNSKENLNYVELTTNKPSSIMLSTDRKFYFAFYLHNAEFNTFTTQRVLVRALIMHSNSKYFRKW